MNPCGDVRGEKKQLKKVELALARHVTLSTGPTQKITPLGQMREEVF